MSKYKCTNCGNEQEIVVVEKTITDDIWQNFKRIHFEASGNRITRDSKTWDFQQQLIMQNRAFMSIISDKNTGKMVGCGYFQYSLQSAIYSSGAYDRTLFSKPLGHLVQWNAIKHMQKINLKNYYIGRYFTSSDECAPTKKEIDISHFLKGFTNEISLIWLATI